MEEIQPQSSNRPLIRQPWPGCWRTKRALARLERFKNLIIHRERWGPDMMNAPPLQELFPGEKIESNNSAAFQRIEQAIKLSAPLVFWDLQRMGIPTGLECKTRDPITGEMTTTRYDAITDYFRLPRTGKRGYDAVMEVLQHGIGAYTARLQQAKRDLWNPLVWIAYLVRIPITVLEHAGLAAHPKSQEVLINTYAWFIRIAMGALILTVAVHYGAKVPWNEILPALFK